MTERYSVIYSDPAWEFEAWSAKGTGRSAEQHYTTTGLEAMKALPVADLAADDSCLIMWIVDSHLVQALELMAAWGFTYKTVIFQWVKVQNCDLSKPRTGMGLWTRKNAEIALLGTRGKPRRQSKGVEQVLLEIEDEETTVLLEPKTTHSRKPTAFYERIEALLPPKYLELFGRTQRPGWDIWGNQAGDAHPLLKPLFPPPLVMPEP